MFVFVVSLLLVVVGLSEAVWAVCRCCISVALVDAEDDVSCVVIVGV